MTFSHHRRGPLARLTLSGLVLMSTLLGPGLHTHEMGSEAYVRLLLHSDAWHSLERGVSGIADLSDSASPQAEDWTECERSECSEHRVSGDHSHCPICFLQLAPPAAGASVASHIHEREAEAALPPDSPCINRRIHVRSGRAPPLA